MDSIFLNCLDMDEKISADEYEFELLELGSILKFTWKKCDVTPSRFKEIVYLFAEMALKFEPEFLYVDARLNTFTMTQDVQNWHDLVIIPMYNRAKIKAIAFLIPSDLYSKVSHKQTFKRRNATKAIQSRFFETEDYVLHWFRFIS
jgi:hypothetical protein